ncbi:MAG: hypothetical protein KDJ52_22540 [Anaerolineae bacterium]|nr:hypothetical protein [Anaerolineae bacterium]
MNKPFSSMYESSQKGLVNAQASEKQPFVEPKLSFIEPKLVKQGKLENVTAGFFGTFYP